jgi:hypothetical protein
MKIFSFKNFLLNNNLDYRMLNFIKLFITMNIFFGSSIALADAAEPWQLGFQDPATPAMEGIITFHNDIMFFFNCNCYFCYLVNGSMFIYV